MVETVRARVRVPRAYAVLVDGESVRAYETLSTSLVLLRFAEQEFVHAAYRCFALGTARCAASRHAKAFCAALFEMRTLVARLVQFVYDGVDAFRHFSEQSFDVVGYDFFDRRFYLAGVAYPAEQIRRCGRNAYRKGDFVFADPIEDVFDDFSFGYLARRGGSRRIVFRQLFFKFCREFGRHFHACLKIEYRGEKITGYRKYAEYRYDRVEYERDEFICCFHILSIIFSPAFCQRKTETYLPNTMNCAIM